MTRKCPENDNPNVHVVHELTGSGHCKERSDGIAIVTKSIASKVSRYLAHFLAYYTQGKNEIQPPIRLALDDSRSSGRGEVESHERFVDCVHAIYDVF